MSEARGYLKDKDLKFSTCLRRIVPAIEAAELKGIHALVCGVDVAGMNSHLHWRVRAER